MSLFHKCVSLYIVWAVIINTIHLCKGRYVGFNLIRMIHLQHEIVGKSCLLPDKTTGSCQSYFECNDLFIPGFTSSSKICKWVAGAPIICCTSNEKSTHESTESKESSGTDTGPSSPSCIDYSCGYPYGKAPIYAYDKDGKHGIYYLNKTAKLLEEKGYRIVVEEMFSDALRKFTYRNGTFSDTMYFDKIDGMSPVGGKPAIRERSYYMALIGEKTDGDTIWYCDGVLINKQWVLTAAHCFAEVGIQLNIVRLGEMNWSKTAEEQPDNDPEDFHFQRYEIHPEFRAVSRYHDLALILLHRPIAEMQHSMNPICLPWGKESMKSHVGSNLTLTGWGATSYKSVGGKKSPMLHEVELEVFRTSKCIRSYSNLKDYRIKWKNGMSKRTVLCAGSTKGGKDACRGDSGAPLVYQNSEQSFVLAGIVSTGFGCGLKKYPGIYIPINNYYLQWIKDVAFNNC